MVTTLFGANPDCVFSYKEGHRRIMHAQAPDTNLLPIFILLIGDNSDPSQGQALPPGKASPRQREGTRYLHDRRLPPQVFQGRRGEVEGTRGALLKQQHDSCGVLPQLLHQVF